MADHPSKEFQEFTSLVDRLLKVPKEKLHEKMQHHRRKVAAEREANPIRPGRKPKEKTEPEPTRKKRR